MGPLLGFFALLCYIITPLYAWGDHKDNTKGHVIAIGQAMYNTYAQFIDEHELASYLDKYNVQMGQAAIITKDQAEELSESIISPVKRYSGGGAANTAAGISALGGSASFVGVVARDREGYSFDEDMRMIGVDTSRLIIKNSTQNTGVVFSLIGTDGKRTILGYPGVSSNLSNNDIDWPHLLEYKAIFIEGYILDSEFGMNIMRNCIDIARESNVITALSLSSVEVAKRYQDELLKLIPEFDIVFANESEVLAMFNTKSIELAIKALGERTNICVITLGQKGAIIIQGDNVSNIIPKQNIKVVDTTGAGDMFAAGFLYGYTEGLDIKTCGKLGSELAEMIISQIGSKPERMAYEVYENAISLR